MANNSNKVAIVTGASRGIGAAVAQRLAKDGFTVVINYSADSKSAEALAQKIEAGGGRALSAKADVSNPNAVRGMFDAAEAAFGGVDVLVNNAGIMKLARIADSDDALFDQQIAINLKGSFNAMREAAKRLRDGGRIINFSTSVVGTKLETYGVYAATKAAVETMTAILSKELRGRSITVNAVAPGPVATDLFLQRQIAGTDRALCQDEPAGAARHARRYRLECRLPRRPGRLLDQRSDTARQWRHGLNRLNSSTSKQPDRRKGYVS